MSQIDLGQVQASVSVGPTTVGTYGSAPSVANSGTAQNVVLNFTLPSSAYSVSNHGTSDTTFALTPNVYHIWGEVSSLTLTLASPSDASVMSNYMFEFVSGSTPTTLSLPSSVEWAINCGDIIIQPSLTYQVSIVNNIAIWIAK